MRVAPRPAVALVVFAAYLVVFYGIWIALGIEYDKVGDSAETIAKWYVAPLAGGALVLAFAVTRLGWWRPVLREDSAAGPRWMLAAPALMLAIAVLMLVTKDYSSTTTAMFLLLVVGSVGVGFCEETVTRGVLLTGFRATMTEPRVWLLTCLLFGLLHLPNWVFGAGPGAVGQVVLAFCVGSTLYLLRRVSGSLLPCMALHGFWDFATFIGETPTWVGGLAILNALVGLTLGIVFVRRHRGARTPIAGVPAATPA